MERVRESRKSLSRVVALLLGLVGVSLCAVGLAPGCLPSAGCRAIGMAASASAGAQDFRALQVWPDRSVGVSSGVLEGSTAYADTRVFPFGVYTTPDDEVVYGRTYLHFPLDVFPPGTDIQRATLHVYVDGASGAGEATLGAYRVIDPADRNPWEETGWTGDPGTWPEVLRSPVAITTARFGAVTPGQPASTPSPSATPPIAPTPTLTATEVSRSFSRPAGHGLVQGQSAVLSIGPQSAEVGVGSTTTVDVRIDDVTDLDYVDLCIVFDPLLLEVVDADPDMAGVQVAPGSFLGPDSTDENDVDLEAGEIYLYQVASEGPVSGSGMLAMITFRGKAAGTSSVSFDEDWADLADAEGEDIEVEFQHGSLTVTGVQASTSTPSPTSTSSTSPLPTATRSGSPLLTPTPGPTPTPSSTPTPGPTSTPGPSPTPQVSPTPVLPADVPVISLGQVPGTWLTWDVTALMRAWMARQVADEGLALAPAPDPDADPEAAGDLLVARWLAVDDPATRPYLIVEFEVLPVTPTPVPVLPPAGGDAGRGAMGVVLVGAALVVLGMRWTVVHGERG